MHCSAGDREATDESNFGITGATFGSTNAEASPSKDVTLAAGVPDRSNPCGSNFSDPTEESIPRQY